MNKDVLISITMTCYNQGHFFKQAVRSVVEQSYKNWQLVIVDDCSTDNSLDVIKKYVKSFKIEEKTKIIERTKNHGYGSSLRKAVENSDGELVGILDCDDALTEDALRISVKKHIGHPKVVLTYSHYRICNAALKPIRVYKTKPRGKGSFLSVGGRVSHFKVFKKKLYDKTEGFNPKLKQSVDKDLILKLEEVGQLLHIDAILYLYRHHKHNLSRTWTKKGKKYRDFVGFMRKQIYEDARKRRGIITNKEKGEDKIDILMVATLRPDILKRTLDSWCKNMLTDRNRYRLVLHIDAIGEDCKPEEILNIAKSYFSDIKYKINLKDFSHSKAFQWTWDQAETEYVLMIDDDWELLKEIDINNLITVHRKLKDLANLRLPKMPIPKMTGELKYKGQGRGYVSMFKGVTKCDYVYHKRALIATKKYNQMTINPTLYKGSFIKEIRQYLDVTKDPELQFKLRGKNKKVEDIINKWDIGMYATFGETPYVKDIGREWMKKMNFTKAKKSSIPLAMMWNIKKRKSK
jgi:glycosyltransferase involved in cell wall biosynthesis